MDKKVIGGLMQHWTYTKHTRYTIHCAVCNINIDEVTLGINVQFCWVRAHKRSKELRMQTRESNSSSMTPSVTDNTDHPLPLAGQGQGQIQEIIPPQSNNSLQEFTLRQRNREVWTIAMTIITIVKMSSHYCCGGKVDCVVLKWVCAWAEFEAQSQNCFWACWF